MSGPTVFAQVIQAAALRARKYHVSVLKNILLRLYLFPETNLKFPTTRTNSKICNNVDGIACY